MSLALAVSVQLRPSGAQRPRPVTLWKLASSWTLFSAFLCSLVDHAGSLYW